MICLLNVYVSQILPASIEVHVVLTYMVQCTTVKQ